MLVKENSLEHVFHSSAEGPGGCHVKMEHRESTVLDAKSWEHFLPSILDKTIARLVSCHTWDKLVCVLSAGFMFQQACLADNSRCNSVIE